MKTYVYEKELGFRGKICRICGRIIKIFLIILFLATPFALILLFPEFIGSTDTIGIKDYWFLLFYYSFIILLFSIFIFLKVSKQEGRGRKSISRVKYNNPQKEEDKNIRAIDKYIKKQRENGGFKGFHKGFHSSHSITYHRGEKIIFKAGKDNILLIGVSKYGKLNGRGRIYTNGKLTYDGYFKNGRCHGWGMRGIRDDKDNLKYIREGIFIKGDLRRILKNDRSSILDSLLNSFILFFYHSFRNDNY